MEEWQYRRKVLKAEFVALMALPRLTPSREQVEGARGGIGSPRCLQAFLRFLEEE